MDMDLDLDLELDLGMLEGSLKVKALGLFLST